MPRFTSASLISTEQTSDAIEITIKAPTGAGKSFIAAEIAHHLESLGFENVTVGSECNEITHSMTAEQARRGVLMVARKGIRVLIKQTISLSRAFGF